MRQRFKCSICGLKIVGKMMADGTIKASDRGATDATLPEQPCVCVHCQQTAPWTDETSAPKDGTR